MDLNELLDLNHRYLPTLPHQALQESASRGHLLGRSAALCKRWSLESSGPASDDPVADYPGQDSLTCVQNPGPHCHLLYALASLQQQKL
jgi:hypothetical protein